MNLKDKTLLNTLKKYKDNISTSCKPNPKLREYVKKQQEYPLQHNGEVSTFFGDRLVVDEWKYYQKATSSYEKKSLAARIGREGCNYPIQGIDNQQVM